MENNFEFDSKAVIDMVNMLDQGNNNLNVIIGKLENTLGEIERYWTSVGSTDHDTFIAALRNNITGMYSLNKDLTNLGIFLRELALEQARNAGTGSE